MKKALVTGSQGFIGQNLSLEISDRFLVHEMDQEIFQHENWIEVLKKTLDELKPDVVFHVGACSDTLEQDVNYMMIRNFEFTKILSEYCYIKEVPLIYSSSAANYGTNNLHPSNLYGWSKYAAEQMVILNGGIALRYFNVYGPKEEHKGKMASVAYQMMTKVKNGEDVKLFPGNPKRDFIYVKDVISANLYAYEHYDKLDYNYYDVGSGDARTFEDVMFILGIPFTYHNESDIPAGYQFFTQSDKNKWMPGWAPKYDLEKGLNDYFFG
jgi:ADP-L-glycero-D-manno-heptose 6-epimerase